MRFEDMVVATGEYTGCRVTREIYEKIRASREESSVIYLEGAENDPQVWECLMPAYAMPSTDSMEYRPGEGHPQIAGSFPRYLRQMVREQGLLDWPEAIRKATILPAQTARIRERGSLQPGWKADAVVFDPESIQDNARYPHLGRPDAVPGGIDCVFVNGRLAADHGGQPGLRNRRAAGQSADRYSVCRRGSVDPVSITGEGMETEASVKKEENENTKTGRNSYGRFVWRRFLRHKAGVISAVVLIILVTAAVLAPLIAPHAEKHQERSVSAGKVV